MRGKGEGAVFKDKRTGYWTAAIELPQEGGKRKRKFIRRKLKADLLDALAEQKATLKAKGYLPDAGMTTDEWFAFWLDLASKRVRPNTYDGYMRSVKNHILPVIGGKRLSHVEGNDIERVYARILEAGWSSTTALLAHNVMGVAFKAAVKRKRIVINPMESVDKPLKAATSIEAFDLEEALAVLEHVLEDPEMGARWAMALLTGARRGEVLGLEISRVTDTIDLSWQMQRLSRSTETGKPIAPANFEYRHLSGSLYLVRPKSHSSEREFPNFEPLRTILERHIAQSEPNPYGLVFTNKGRPIDPTKDSKNWKKVLEATGIEKDVVLHGLRHTAVDLLFLANMPEDLISEIVGHSTQAMTRKYKSRGKVNRARLNAALEGFTALFSSLGDGHSSTPAAVAPSPQALELGELRPESTA